MPAPLTPPASAPRAALRVACTGSNDLAAASPAFADRATSVFDILAEALAESDKHPDKAGREAPRLQLLSGLSNNVEQCLATIFLAGKTVDREHVAVLPFDKDRYRHAVHMQHRAAFDRLIAQSSLVIELDGRDVAPADDSNFAELCRSRARRSRTRLMLQRCDLLLAVPNFDDKTHSDETAETVRTALILGIPVLALGVTDANGEPGLHLLRELAEFESLGPWIGAPEPIEPAKEKGRLRKLVVEELAPPARPLSATPRRVWLERLWSRFEKRFDPPAKPGGRAGSRPAALSTSLESHSPFHAMREQVRQLNARYSGRYRGGFLVNFSFAAFATALAAGSLSLMAIAAEHGMAHNLPVLLALLVLVILKFGLVATISQVTHRANEDGWNDQGIMARYLAENLRLLYWLPSLGKLRAPRRMGEHHSKLTQQHKGHTADALLKAAVRAAPACTGLTPLPDRTPACVAIEPIVAVRRLKDLWIDGQIEYHRRNAKRMEALHKQLGNMVEHMNSAVTKCVVLDFAALGFVLCNDFKADWLNLLEVSLVAAAATLPAAVAATNGIREQSEANRLAERSEQLCATLKAIGTDARLLLKRNKEVASTDQDPGGWTLESLALAERCASLVAEDVAEWSVLYRKEMPDT